jgi:hypothetical protein
MCFILSLITPPPGPKGSVLTCITDLGRTLPGDHGAPHKTIFSGVFLLVMRTMTYRMGKCRYQKRMVADY